jgi:inosine-uridine nucleoside N-ribohydrolase
MTDIILDTDIGDDIDDAYALHLAARSPEIRLVGVTTVFRSAARRAQMAARLLDELGRRDVPVRAGCDLPLVEGIRVSQNDSFDESGAFVPCQHAGEYDGMTHGSEEHAVDFLIRTAREAPGRITVVGIGPQTNIAVALRKAPDLAAKLAGITVMGGVFGEQFPEWNILCDPEAAWIVCHAGVPLTMVGLDVTTQCRLDGRGVDRIAARETAPTRLLHAWTSRWRERNGFRTPILHDPLAVATLVDPSLVTFEERAVDVALEGRLRGCTPTRKPAGPHGEAVPAPRARIAAGVDAARFGSFFLERILA